MKTIPYSRQSIDDDDIAAVVAVLRSDYLTTGPKVPEFEAALCAVTGAKHAVAVSSGTAALHLAMLSLGIGPGDEVIVPAMTFVATANAVRYCGGTPVIVDVLHDTLLIDPECVRRAMTDRTKAIIGVDYAGQPADYEALKKLGVPVVADACHSLGAKGVGTLADLTCLSFHPVKSITTGEGGAVLTNDPYAADRCMELRNHGRIGAESMTLGYNYRMSDIHAALGLSQIRKLKSFVASRRQISDRYGEFCGRSAVTCKDSERHARHLYVVRIRDRDGVQSRLRDRGICAGVHYVPVNLQAAYRNRVALCPAAEMAGREVLSLPCFPAMSDSDVDRVISALRESI